MDDEWIPVIAECQLLARQTGQAAPDFEAVLNPKQAGRLQADIWLKETQLLRLLSGFLEQVNRSLKQSRKTKRSDLRINNE